MNKKVIEKFKVESQKSKKLDEVWVVKEPGEELDIKYKIVVEDGGELELKGKVVIKETAINSKAFLEMRVLQLGEKSRVVVVPDLEINTNEVRASHAVSVARVDEEQVFYMMSRGLSREEAVELLVKSFLN